MTPQASGLDVHDAAVGCAGWSIPRQHAGLFADGESVLARYATRFPVVEINSSFYRSHRRATYARWAGAVPAGFRFSVKIPKRISHEFALRGCAAALDQFLGEVGGLAGKLGGCLLQLPPSQRFEPRVASTFFRMWQRRDGGPLACEPRHPSWFSPAAETLFLCHGVSRVIADPPIAGSHGTMPEAPWPYWRLHGTPRMYYSPYADDALRGFAADAAARASGASPWIIFDNTAHGHAVADAARLQDLLKAGKRRRAA